MSLLSQHGRRAAALLVLAAAALAVGPAAGAAVAEADLSGGCSDGQGVTVVVDLTDLGGAVEVGCAPTAATGAEALTAAGFTDTRDASGLLCAIETMPDPCPAEFTGSWWSYWYAAPGGEWQTYNEGPDTATPQPGAYEGWRYSDGTSGPTVTPADVAAAASAQPTASTAPTASSAGTADPDTSDAALAVAAGEQETGGTPAWVVAAVAVVGIGALAAVIVGLQRRRRDLTGPPGQD